MADRILQIYIHPAVGPILPLPINMNLVEEAGIANLHDPNGARIQEIVKQITAKYPKSQPESNRTGLQQIVARMSSFAQISGIVLHTEGTIDAVAEAPSRPSPIGPEDLDQLMKEVQQLRNQLNAATHELRQRVLQLQQAQSENDRLRQHLAALQADRDQAYARLAQAQHAVPTNDATLQQAREQILAFQRQIAALETALAAAQQNGSREEVLTLRTQLRDAQATADRLQDQLAARDEEIAQLKRGIQAMNNPSPPFAQPPTTPRTNSILPAD